MEESVLVVGLVCLDRFLWVEQYPQEDSDLPAKKSWMARGGNAANNCTVLAQYLTSVEFLGTLPKPKYGNQLDFILKDFAEHNIKLSHCCPIRHEASWPGNFICQFLFYFFKYLLSSN